jgi:hypothetical protein
MNAHVPPPGGQGPREPPWVQEVRDMVDSINRTSGLIHDNVARYIRWHRRIALTIVGAAFLGQWLGWGTEALLKWWVGLP